jgi:hypothetical protein
MLQVGATGTNQTKPNQTKPNQTKPNLSVTETDRLMVFTEITAVYS